MSKKRRQEKAPVPAGTSAETDGALIVRVFLYESAIAAGILAILLFGRFFSEVPAIWAGLVPLVAALAGGAYLVFPKDRDRAHQFAIANGLAIIVLMRVSVDGMTFPHYNIPFLWGIALLTILWGTLTLMRGAKIDLSGFHYLLLALLATAALLGFGTFQPDNTIRALLNWSAYIALFALASAALRSRLSLGVVLGAFIVAALVEAVFAHWHLHYILPDVRQLLQQDPDMVKVDMGMSELTPELVHRLNSNRAFGSFLFPNALGAFMALAAPTALGILGSRLLILLGVLGSHEGGKENPRPQTTPLLEDLNEPAAVAVLSGFVAFFACFIGYYIFYYHILPNPGPWTHNWLSWLLYVVVVPLVIAAIGYTADKKYGLRFYGLLLQCLFSGAAFLFCTYALVLSFSRGAMLAYTASLALGALLLFHRRIRLLIGQNKTRAAATLALVILPLFLVGAADVPTPGGEGIQRSGMWLSPQELAKTTTFGLRLGYWRVGATMFFHHPFQGVGLGNFGVAYPRYQFEGAGDTKQAHNDYLQMACETGIVGGALFTAFWIWFLLWGARRILRVEDRAAKWLLTGLYCGVLAFQIHALVDFNYSNPSLVMFQFVIAGLFYTYAQMTPNGESPELAGGGGRFVTRYVFAAAVIVIVGVASIAGMRIRPVDNILSRVSATNARFMAAQFLLENTAPGRPAPEEPPRIACEYAQTLIPPRSALETFGRIFTPREDNPSLLRSVGDNEPVPPGAVLVIGDRAKAYEITKKAIERWILLTEQADKAYPFSPDIAIQLFSWHDTQIGFESNPDERARLIRACAHWSKAAVDRSPYQSVYLELYGSSLWALASLETQYEERRSIYEEGLEYFRLAAIRYPIGRHHWQKYGEKLLEFGQALKTKYQQTGKDASEAEKFISEGQDVLAYAATLTSH